MQKIGYFCELLNSCFEENETGIRKNSDLVKKIGSNKITMRNLQRYRRGTAVPRYENALLILQMLGYNIEGEDLAECLAISRIYARQINQDTQERTLIRKSKSKLGISVSGCKVTCVEMPELKKKIRKRIAEVSGTDADINAYVAALIEKDLIESDKGENA